MLLSNVGLICFLICSEMFEWCVNLLGISMGVAELKDNLVIFYAGNSPVLVKFFIRQLCL